MIRIRSLPVKIFSVIRIRCISNVAQIPNEQQNVDLKDVEHHASLHEDWWNVHGPMKGLHAMNQCRVPFIRDGLISTGIVQSYKINKRNVLDGINILEVGCGAGILTEALAKLNANVVALEPSQKLIDTATKHLEDTHFQNHKIQYLCETVESHAEANKEKYDAVVISEVLEHIKDQKTFLKSSIEALKPGGSVFITTFNKTQASWLGGIIAAEQILKLVPAGTHDWNQFISPEEVDKLLKEFNCSTVLVHGIKYEFWRNTCSWTQRTDINYALQAVKE